MESLSRIALTISGRVQGVGFRPHVWRLAASLGLTGNIRNTSRGVEIEVQGIPKALAEFEARLSRDAPTLARITALESKPIPLRVETRFEILQSQTAPSQHILVSPDIGICQECLEDIRDPGNPRFGYPFTNCTNCGPRYSITRNLPYDRESTSMACFELCPMCAGEYQNPANRRFHAQPIACPDCGPSIWYVDKNTEDSSKTAANMADALAKAGRLILSGGILALKGLGGFQLVCDAKSQAVARLRELKRRPHKALAVMCASVETAASFVILDDAAQKILDSPEKPITLLPKKESSKALSPLIAPDCSHIGVMLPYTPLHALLLDWLHKNGLENPVLVMTSANPPDEPICLGNREALARLAPIADAWILHDRDILVRVDDSVVALEDASPRLIRRARGYTPAPVPTPDNTASVLGCGAQLKGTFCLTRANEAFISQHIGDLSSPAAMQFYREALAHMTSLLETEPVLCVRDTHPDFLSSQFAEEYAASHNIPCLELQHHAAHAFAVLGENKSYRQALAICLDGTGLGEAGEIWGGEFILADLESAAWKRLGSFAPFPLVGGEKAILEPWRVACVLAGEKLPNRSESQYRAICELADKKINSPLCSSCGRVFDAVASILGYCDEITYEGQAAIQLETAAANWLKGGKLPVRLDTHLQTGKDLPLIDSHGLAGEIGRLYKAGYDRGELAAAFHYGLAENCANLAGILARQNEIEGIAICGGVFHNRIFLSRVAAELKRQELTPLFPRELPYGDGAIAYGQAIWGQRVLARANK